MLAGIFEKEGVFRVRDVQEPQLRLPDDVKVAVKVAGVCGTDVHIVSTPQTHPGTPGIILGHEFVGTVVEVGVGVKELQLGDLVVAGPNIACGECASCLRGRKKFCANNQAMGITRDGGFAELVVAPVRALYPVPCGLLPEHAIFAEPLSCIINGINRLGHVFGERVLILGTGPIGLLFVQVFRNFCAKEIFSIEPDVTRRNVAEACGATACYERSADLPEHFEADIVVDTTGFLLDEALGFTKPGGQVLLFGMDHTCNCSITPFDITRYEKTVIGCFIDNDVIPRCLDLIPYLDPNILISHRLPLCEAEEAIQTVRSNRGIKTLLYPHNESREG